MIATYRYSFDGVKREAKVTSGASSVPAGQPIAYAYLGSLVYTKTGGSYQLESTDFSGGRMDNGLTASTDNRYRFSGKEAQPLMGGSILDFGARYYNPVIARWNRIDPMPEISRTVSSFVYCHCDPINRVDIEGKWDIIVSACQDRGKHRYAVLTAYTQHGTPFFKTVVGVVGKNRERSAKNNDTPTGKYRMIDWAQTGPGTRYPVSSYGINDILRLNYLSGEGKGRNGMHIHGGGNQNGKLTSTLGCIRINDDDILLLKQLVELLYSIDDTESFGYVYVNDDLQEPVEYQDRFDVLDSVGYNGGEINPSIIQSYIYYPRLSFQSLYYEYLQNIESHNNVENE